MPGVSRETRSRACVGVTARPIEQGPGFRAKGSEALCSPDLDAGQTGPSGPPKSDIFCAASGSASAESLRLGGDFFSYRLHRGRDGEREMSRAAGLGEQSGDFGSGGLEVVSRVGGCEVGREVAEHGGELQLGEERAAGGVVRGCVRIASRENSMGTFGVNGDEFLGEQDVVAVVLQRLAIGLAS
jgi:hypothetical protein